MRERLIAHVATRVSAARPGAFLRSFFGGEPDWSLLKLEADVASLPAVQWKLLNLRSLRARQADKFAARLTELEMILGI